MNLEDKSPLGDKPYEMGVHEFDPYKNGFDWPEGIKALWITGLLSLLVVSLVAYSFLIF